MCRASIQYREWGPNDVRLFAGPVRTHPEYAHRLRCVLPEVQCTCAIHGPCRNVGECQRQLNSQGGLAVTRTSPSLWRVTFNNPRINLIHPPMIRYKHVAVVLFDSADAGFLPSTTGISLLTSLICDG